MSLLVDIFSADGALVATFPLVSNETMQAIRDGHTVRAHVEPAAAPPSGAREQGQQPASPAPVWEEGEQEEEEDLFFSPTTWKEGQRAERARIEALPKVAAIQDLLHVQVELEANNAVGHEDSNSDLPWHASFSFLETPVFGEGQTEEEAALNLAKAVARHLRSFAEELEKEEPDA